MTTLTVYDTPRAKPATGTWTRVRKAGATFVVLGALAAVFFTALAKSGADARFVWGTSSVGTGVSAPARPGALVFGLLCVACGVVLLTGRADRWLRWLAGLALTVLVLSFLCWQVAGQAMPLGSTAQATAKEALPLVLGALCGVLCERSGVINVAIEGQLLTVAFMAALVGTVAASACAGRVAAAIGGLFIALLLAVLAIRYLVDQVVLGVVLNVLALGPTGLLLNQ